ncbi:DNA-binding PadR family transcriptional regulator [Rhizobium paranaense]|uniref:DNA-binding PadR family transcriptional regulator n=2 Tax=Rhizobium/Agrobacterium group TaxID=227290 RepID=A0A7W8XXK4_9HYPH|nr:DNA-binding PadR family transcriptional regulator [Rhizobium paranaense]
MHGHRLRLEADRKRVPFWTDIPVGAVYGAMKRLAAEGLLREAGQEKQGNRPTRQLYEITDAGKTTLEELRILGLTDIWFKYDPFDLALTKANAKDLEDFTAVLADRLERMKALLAERREMIEGAIPYIGLIEEWALRHTERRLAAEVDYLTELIAFAPAISDDQHNPRARKEKVLTKTKGGQRYMKQK